ncbi:hypothetical protein [Nocardioides sp.]|uniref:hypothetical protein n=1 Tax=Nocardioides sp. TaxID=35761 RepID=UPI003D0FC0DF
MSTVSSWTDALADTRSLVQFRTSTVRQKGRTRWFVAILVTLTLLSAIVPAFLPGAADYSLKHSRAFEMFLLLPTAYAGFLLLTTISAVASGGGRELVARDQAVAFPISPAVDHLGALLMAPLNIAWLLQGWMLLGLTAYVVGPAALVFAHVIALLWLVWATAVAQVVAWSMEAIRRGPHGVLAVRGITALVGLAALALILTKHVSLVLDHLPTLRLVSVLAGLTQGIGLAFPVTLLILLALIGATVLLGVLPARVALRRAPRDEARIETGNFPARRNPSGPLAAMIRMDRSGVWRAVSLRRGIYLLAAAPGLIALSGSLEWKMLTILPGLVASGAALLFGVNAWCLDGRGGLWRDTLPVSPSLTFFARSWVLLELLLVSSATTLALAALRAGKPTVEELTALLCAWLVVCAQVVSLSMRWSVKQPFSVDLRSARATPAPPLYMVGYSARLALSTTITGMIFSGLAQVPDWRASVILAIPMALYSFVRLMRVRAQWANPFERSRVVATVSA